MESLFEVPTPVLGLMGQRRRVRQDPLALLAGASIPVYEQGQFDEGDQRFLDAAIARGEVPPAAPAQSGVSLSALQNMRPQQPVQTMPPQSAMPQRERVSGWRLLDRVLGGQTITEGLDSERARLSAEAMRPQIMAQRQATLDSITDPRERALFLTSPEDWAKNIGQQFAPQVVSPGAVQAIGGRAVVGAPQQYEFGDTRRSFNPVTGVDSVVATRGPTIAEQTTIDRLGLDRELGQGRLAVDRGQLNVAQSRLGLDEATAGFTLGQGQQRFDASGAPVAAVSAAPRPENMEIRGRIDTIQRESLPTLTRQRELLTSGDVITGLGADARLQAARVLAAAGNRDAQRQVAATEELRNLSGRLRVSLAKSLGANPSNADIQLLEQITGGNISQNNESLLRLIDQGIEFANRNVQDLQRQTGGSGGGQVVTVTTPAEAAALPPGTRYRNPQGVEYIR